MCPGFRHKDWEELPGFLLAFWPCSYRSGPHISHCCYIKDPRDPPKFSLLIFTFGKFPPTVEWFSACKSQWAFASASKESLPLHLYLHTRSPCSSASCPATRGRPSVPAFPDTIEQRHGGAGASRQAGKALSASHPQSVILPTPRAPARFPLLPHAPGCRYSVHTSLPARSSARPASFSVLPALSFGLASSEVTFQPSLAV